MTWSPWLVVEAPIPEPRHRSSETQVAVVEPRRMLRAAVATPCQALATQIEARGEGAVDEVVIKRPAVGGVHPEVVEVGLGGTRH